MNASGNKRERGAYFTPAWLAQSLANWAIRAPDDVVVDPSAGGGDLLLAAAERLAAVGGNGDGQIFGVELHKRTARALRAKLAAFARADQLLRGDFFSMAARLPQCDIVLANPPYVRHHAIPVRSVAAMRAALNGQAHLVDGRASAWAYFLVRAPALLRAHGRLAFVLPAEVLMSDYAEPIVKYLVGHFESVKLIHCHRVIFRNLGQQTVICLADNYHAAKRPTGEVEWASLDVDGALDRQTVPRLSRVACDKRHADSKLMRLLAPRDAVAVDHLLQEHPDVQRLGALASVGIGYVTGSNRFFHLTEVQRKELGLRTHHLIRVVTRSRGSAGIEFTLDDWSRLRHDGDACWLFAPKHTNDKSVKKLLRRGRRARIHTGLKCENRTIWWKVQVKTAPPAFMIYMGAHPAVRANSASVRVPNSLYEVRELRGISARNLAVASMTSVFQLSAILNARLLGGGLRKLEPSDAKRILVPVASVAIGVANKIDKLVRAGRLAEARNIADSALLVERLRWPAGLVRRIGAALESLEAESETGSAG